MLTVEKNRTQNCLTISNLHLDDVFSDVFCKSSRSIIQCILEHPGERFDVAPFLDWRCKHSVDKVQAAVDGAISYEQAARLKECLTRDNPKFCVIAKSGANREKFIMGGRRVKRLPPC